MQSPGVLAALLLVCLGAGYLGSLATAESVKDWYPGLVKRPGRLRTASSDRSGPRSSC